MNYKAKTLLSSKNGVNTDFSQILLAEYYNMLLCFLSDVRFASVSKLDDYSRILMDNDNVV